MLTPFGDKLRALRARAGMTQKAMAEAVGVSPAYLSALEHGHRGTPRWILVQDIIRCLNVIWDDADELQRLAMLSAPKASIDTSHLSARATELANTLAATIDDLSDADMKAAIDWLNEKAANAHPRGD